MRPFAALPFVASTRRIGTIAALDVAVPEGGYLSAIAPVLLARFRELGVLLRPLGNVVYVMPPYCITDDQLAAVYRAIDQVCSHVASQQ